MFEGFRRGTFATPMAGGAGHINYVVAGSGPPMLLLHGHPQSHIMWHIVAPRLAATRTVVCADLRGYGDSAKPAGDARHENYSKRAMAADMVALMAHLGFPRFDLVGHDRGGRVGQRLCLDDPDAVARFMPVDIAPTLAIYEGTNLELATRYFHWFFLIQAHPFPENLISHDIDFYLPWMLGQRWGAPIVHTAEAQAEYLRCAKLPGAIHAMCEDYRASASIDLDHDRADLAAGRRIACPVRAVWSKGGVIDRMFDPIRTFQPYCALPVTGAAIPGGHYLAEESPDELTREIADFFG
ncbi:MAG: alpha/beta hydrolase [Rhodospirillales bacterium]|nr:MAG: alpha/beta hydrolase [Rhodospirillales bacterium]